jgi:PKD repeat protein
LIIGSPIIKRNYRYRTVATSLILGIVIFGSTFSVFIFWGYNASAYDSGYDKALGRRDFPSASEFSLFRLLRNDTKNPLTFNVAAPANEYAFHTGDLIGKIHAFSGIPWAKLTQSPLTLNASTLEGFYDLLHRSDTHYIVLPKKDFNNLITASGKDDEAEISGKGGQEIDEDINEDRVAGEENEPQGQQKTTLGIEEGSIEEAGVLRFAIENFQKVYEDGKYLVLAVPSLTSQQSQADIGLIIPKNNLLPPSLLSDNDSIALGYDKLFFPAEETGKLARSGKLENSTAGSILHGDKGEVTTLWSNPLKQCQFQNSNYIEAVFRILGENKTSNDAGIMWNDRNKEYTASLRNDRLEILVKPIDVGNSKETSEKKLINVRDITREIGVWYRLKVITLEDYINIYINDLLAAKVPRDSNESDSKPSQQVTSTIPPPRNRTGSNIYPPISPVGIFSFNNIAEFKPIEIGQIQLQPYEKDRARFEHDYPLNMLALSKLNYETFIEGDPSVFSKEIIVLDMSSFNQLYSRTMNNTASKLPTIYEDGITYPKNKTINYYYDNNTENKLLEFVKKGGTLVITNVFSPDSEYFPNQTIFQNTELGELFPFQVGDEIEFDRIGQNIVRDLPNKTNKLEAPQQHYLNISGEAQEIKIKNATSAFSDFRVTSSYMHGNNEVAPFALEKKYGAGKIIVINSGGYFRAIDSSPRQYFQTLAEITGLIDLESVLKNNDKMLAGKALTPNAKPIARVVGVLNISGPSQINSSSMSIFANKIPAGAYSLENDKFRARSTMLNPSDNVSKGTNSSDIPDTKLILQNGSYMIPNAIIRNLSLVGEYEVTITSNNSLVLPSTLGSYGDYIAASIPPGSNMNIKLHDGATAEFIAEKAQHDQPFKISGNSKISFYNVSDLRAGNDLSVLLKSPEVKVDNGRAIFEKIYMYDPDRKISSDGGRLDVRGNMVAKFDHVDNYNEIDSRGGWINTQYLTYLNSIQFGKDNVYDKDKMLSGGFPADISELAKEEGVLVPWQKALLSPMAVTTSLSIIIVAAVTLIIFWRTMWLKQK